jgi:prephenate dehydrogenase
MWKTVRFVGSHPLAGSEKQGFEHADPALFERRICVLTPTEATPRDATERLRGFWEGVGSNVLEMTPEAHDVALGETSHLPHVAAAALAASLDPANIRLTAGGFRDSTRIAGGDPENWSSILLLNADGVLRALGRFERELAEFRAALEHRDGAEIRRLLATARERRALTEAARVG